MLNICFPNMFYSRHLNNQIVYNFQSLIISHQNCLSLDFRRSLTTPMTGKIQKSHIKSQSIDENVIDKFLILSSGGYVLRIFKFSFFLLRLIPMLPSHAYLYFSLKMFGTKPPLIEKSLN